MSGRLATFVEASRIGLSGDVPEIERLISVQNLFPDRQCPIRLTVDEIPVADAVENRHAFGRIRVLSHQLFRRNLAATVVTGWLVWGLFWVQLNLMWMSIYARRALPWTWPVVQNYGMGVVAWAVITPLMLAAARRNSLVNGHRWRRAAAHLMLACGFALLHIALWQTLVHSQRPFWGQGYVETMRWTVMLYLSLIHI